MARLSPYFSFKQDAQGRGYLDLHRRGNALSRMAAINRGTAFAPRERCGLGLEGMLSQVCDRPQQVGRLYRGFGRQADDIPNYQYLRAMQERSEVRFYAMLQDYLEAPVSLFPRPAATGTWRVIRPHGWR